MRTHLSGALLAAALSTLAASGCGYSPNPPSGKLLCGPDESCPEGYACLDHVTCSRPGGPRMCGTTTAEQLIGHWLFVAPSRRQIVCTNGQTDTDTNWTDYFDVEAGGSAELRAFYYCDLDLDIGATGATVLRLGGSCSAQDTTDPAGPVTYTWTPAVFTLSTPDGCTGSLAASIPYTATTAAGTNSCTMDFTGTLTKS